MKAIAAMAENRAIGKGGGLPWKPIKQDFAFFKEFTTGEILIIGRNTFQSLPPLKNRNFVILTSNPSCYQSGYNPIHNSGHCYRDEAGVLEIAKINKDKIIIIGGAKTYELFFPYITEFYVTHVKGTYEADTFMPPFEHLFPKKDVIRAFKDNITIYPNIDSETIKPESLKEFDGHLIIKYSKTNIPL